MTKTTIGVIHTLPAPIGDTRIVHLTARAMKLDMRKPELKYRVYGPGLGADSEWQMPKDNPFEVPVRAGKVYRVVRENGDSLQVRALSNLLVDRLLGGPEVYCEAVTDSAAWFTQDYGGTSYRLLLVNYAVDATGEYDRIGGGPRQMFDGLLPDSEYTVGVASM